MGFVNKYFFGGEVVVNVSEVGNGVSDQSYDKLIAGIENYKTENSRNIFLDPAYIVKAVRLAIVFVATVTTTQDLFCEL